MCKISDMMLRLVCKTGQGANTCRYVICGPNGFECAKHSQLKETLDSRAEAGAMVAQSDNCEGIK